MLQKDGRVVWLCPGSIVSKEVLNTAATWRGSAVPDSTRLFFCLSLLLSQFDKEGLVHEGGLAWCTPSLPFSC